MKINGKIMKAISLACTLLLVLTALSGCTEKTSELILDSENNDGRIVFYTENPEEITEHFDAMKADFGEAKTAFSLEGEDSELRTLNGKKEHYVSPVLKTALEDTVIICTALEDSIDITMGTPLRLWGFGSDSPAVPDSSELQKAIEDRSLDSLFIARDSSKVTISENMEIDMSPVATGITLDRVFRAGKLCSVPYIVTLGNMTLACGEGPEKGGWTIPLVNPLTGEGFAEITVDGKGVQDCVFVSVSDTWEDSFTENGKSYHRYLDTKTGYPSDNSLVSVTVVTESGITADALSDALLVNGYSEKSLDFIEGFMAEAVFVFEDNTYYVTKGLKESFRLLDSSFTEHSEAPETKEHLK